MDKEYVEELKRALVAHAGIDETDADQEPSEVPLSCVICADVSNPTGTLAERRKRMPTGLLKRSTNNATKQCVLGL